MLRAFEAKFSSERTKFTWVHKGHTQNVWSLFATLVVALGVMFGDAIYPIPRITPPFLAKPCVEPGLSTGEFTAKRPHVCHLC